MAIVPLKDHVLVRPYLQSEAFADDVKKRSGLLIAPPDNKKHSFEGIPNQGFIWAVCPGAGVLSPGMHVVYRENNPKGFKDPSDPKLKLFSLELDQIIAIVEEAK